jgi:hypothetical protein
MLGLRASDVLGEQATVERDGASLHVTLRSQDGRVLGERSLPADGSCAELAGVVAVVLAAWLSDVHPEFVGALPAAPPPPPPPPPARPARPSPPSHQGRIGLGLGADFSGSKLVPLATLGLDWTPIRGGFGAFVSATISGQHSVTLSSGSVRYFRWPLQLGPLLRVPLAGSALDVKAGPVLAWLYLSGNGFASSSTRSAFVGGGFISTRIAITAQTFEPYAELGGLLFGPSQAFVQRPADQVTATLPSFELYAAVGASLGAW